MQRESGSKSNDQKKANASGAQGATDASRRSPLRGLPFEAQEKALAPEGPIAACDALRVGATAGVAAAARPLSASQFKALPTPEARALETSRAPSQRTSKPSQPWGSRSQIGAAKKSLADIEGNRDGLWDNEKSAAGTTSKMLQNPMTARVASEIEVGLSGQDEVKELAAYRARKEAEWGQKVTGIGLDQLENGELFAAEKAMMLDRLGRRPNEVTEGFIMARGKVDGREIPPRRIFWQRFKPAGKPSGKVIVVSPGFQETGRDFYDQIDRLNRAGHDVIVMDHQWAGQSDGASGGIDSGFGVARDVAAVAAFADGVRQESYGKMAASQTMLMGNSMGAGPGVLGAMTMNDNGLMALEGAQMPKGLSAVLQSPFLGATPNMTNSVLGGVGKIPGLGGMALPAAGLPTLTHDPRAAQIGAQNAVKHDTRAQAQAMNQATPDLQRIMGLIAQGKGPKGNLEIVHGKGDTLADPAQAEKLAAQTGARITEPQTKDHVLQNNQALNGLAVDAIGRLER